jgi:c-di-GMP-binding flagellar brake protein YcgR
MMRCNTTSVNGNHIMEDDIKSSNSNRRRDDRVSVPESLYVIIDTEPQTMGQVVEISSTGMAFTLVDLNAVSKRLARQAVLHLDLFAGGKGFFLRDVECRLVSKIEKVSSPSPSSLPIKRVGVQFEGLSVPQQVQINRLVRRRNLTSC